MNYRDYCLMLGLKENRSERFSGKYLRQIDMDDLIAFSAITGMSVAEHADEIATLIRREAQTTTTTNND